MTSGFNHITVKEDLTEENIAQLEEFIQNDKPLMAKFSHGVITGTILCSKLLMENIIAYGANFQTSTQSVSILIVKEADRWSLVVNLIT